MSYNTSTFLDNNKQKSLGYALSRDLHETVRDLKKITGIAALVYLGLITNCGCPVSYVEPQTVISTESECFKLVGKLNNSETMNKKEVHYSNESGILERTEILEYDLNGNKTETVYFLNRNGSLKRAVKTYTKGDRKMCASLFNSEGKLDSLMEYFDNKKEEPLKNKNELENKVDDEPDFGFEIISSP